MTRPIGKAAAVPDFVHYGPDAIRRAVGFADLIDPVGAALADFSRGLGAAPISVFAPAGSEGDVHVKSAWLPGRGIFTVKVATWFRARGAAGRPPGAGLIAVFDSRTGDLLAILEDDHHLSDVRTAAAGALAARHMARADAGSLAVLGTGVQAYLQTLAACGERPVESIRLWGRSSPGARRLAAALKARLPAAAIATATTPASAVAGADMVVTATASTEPLVEADWLKPGAHVTAVGADDAGKCELAPDLLASAGRIVVDGRREATTYGCLARAIAVGAVDPADIAAELGAVVAGRTPGRTGRNEVTVCKLIGLGVQDLAAAEVAIERLRGTPAPGSPASILDLRQG